MDAGNFAIVPICMDLVFTLIADCKSVVACLPTSEDLSMDSLLNIP